MLTYYGYINGILGIHPNITTNKTFCQPKKTST